MKPIKLSEKRLDEAKKRMISPSYTKEKYEKDLKSAKRTLKSEKKSSLNSKKSSLNLKKLEKYLDKKVKSKRILKPSNVVVRIKESKPVEYTSIYFKNEWEETKKSLFLK